MEPIISVKSVSKRYDITHANGKYVTLRDVMTNILKSPFSFLKSKAKKAFHGENKEIFWALKDVNFDIKRGEVVGIIGRNGAGKSTLLKILSQITPPTGGEITLRGRVGSLLEVGTGFHPELSGRENILLNGAILGMKKKEIIAKFDEIVAFAGIEKFLDTPVKYYSSGMYVRLAFSVAAHMEPDILIIDEVLAVGDVEFQKKCLGKMNEVSKQDGRTVLFVSHNMNAIEDLCSRVLYFDKGVLIKDSTNVREVVSEYIRGQEDGNIVTEWVNNGKEYRNPYFIPERIAIVDERGDKMVMPKRNDAECWIQIEGTVTSLNKSLTIGYAIFSEEGNLLYWSFHTDAEENKWPQLKMGKNVLRSKFPTRLLNEGLYRIEFISSLHFIQWLTEPGVNAPAVYLTIQGGLSNSPYWMIKRAGLLAPVNEWSSLNQ